MPKKTKTETRGGQIESENPLYARLLGFSARKGDLRKIKILHAAIACIGELGVEATNFESIGKRAGINRAHVQYHFPKRDDIIKAAIEFSAASAQMLTVNLVGQAKTPKEQLNAIVEGALIWAEVYPEQIPIIGLLYYYCGFRPEYVALHTEIRRMGAIRLVAILKRVFPRLKEENLLEKARSIQNLITGTLVSWMSTQPTLKLADVREKLRQDVDQLLAH